MDQTALFEFDSSQTAFINASDEIDVEIQASKAIVSYWQEDLDRILSYSNLRLLFDFPTETATIPFYNDVLHQLIYVFPYACASIAAGTIDRLAALGVKEVLIYGHCFNLDLSSGLLVPVLYEMKELHFIIWLQHVMLMQIMLCSDAASNTFCRMLWLMKLGASGQRMPSIG